MQMLSFKIAYILLNGISVTLNTEFQITASISFNDYYYIYLCDISFYFGNVSSSKSSVTSQSMQVFRDSQ